MVHDDYKELIPAHALSALDPAEDRVLSEHLSSCEECRLLLAEWESTAAGIALSSDPLEPSPSVRARILSEVKNEATRSNVLSFAPSASRNVWSSFGSFGAIAAALVFVVAIGALFVMWRQNQSQKAEIQRLAEEIARTQELLKQNADVMRILSSPGARMTELAATPMAPGATAKIAYDMTGEARLMASGLPEAPAGMAYQLWYIVGDKKMPGKVFSTLNGSGRLADRVPSEAMNAAVFAVTLEPATGVQAPTGQIYLVSRS
jgi:anti-sigma factor RsiW